jgi:hypothetical protein
MRHGVLMALHVFRYKDTDIFALTYDQAGRNLPTPKAGSCRFIETLGPVKFAWGEARANLDLDGFFLFEGEMVPQPKGEHIPLPRLARLRRS